MNIKMWEGFLNAQKIYLLNRSPWEHFILRPCLDACTTGLSLKGSKVKGFRLYGVINVRLVYDITCFLFLLYQSI